MKSKLNKSSKNVEYLYYFGIFSFFLFISYNTPLSGDDWTWGSAIGWGRFQNHFVNYNGRYLSNLLELVMTRSDILRYLIIASFSTLLIVMVGKITSHKKTLIPLLLASILILLTPTKVFAQTFGWTAGFINYVPSLALLLIYVYLIRNIYSEIKPEYNKWLSLIVFPIGILTQLIVEHVTLFSIFTAIWVIIYTYIKHKKIMFFHLSYLASLIIGGIIMFSNGAYWNVLKGTDSYRSVGYEATEKMGLFAKIYYVYSERIYKFLFLENVVINLIIGILIIVLIVRFISNSKWINYIIKPILLSVISTSLLYLLVIKNVLGNEYFGNKTNDFEALLCFLFFMSIVVAITLFVDIHFYKIRLLYYLSGVVFLIAPFIFITPFGPRVVFATYVFMVLVCLELFVYLTESLSYNKLIQPLIVILVVLVMGYGFIFTMNGITSRERLIHLESEIDKKETKIELRELPFLQFHWMPSPKPNLYHTKTFKMYYNVPTETEIEIIPYLKWNNK